VTRTLFILNPTAGSGQALALCAELERRLGAAPGQRDRRVTTRPGEARELAREFGPGYDVVVAVGGDGTAGEVASGLLAIASPHPAMAILPCGTGNDFAHDLSVRTVVDTQAALTHGQARKVDVIDVHLSTEGQARSCHGLLFASVGITSDLLRRTTAPMKQMFGRRLAYRVGLLRALWSYRAPRMHVTLDGQSWHDRFLFASASNAECAGGGMRIAPGSRVDDGHLNVNLIRNLGRFQALRQFLKLCQGRHTGHPDVRYLTARSLAIASDPPIEVAVDGDLVGSTPARFEVRPQAIAVLANGHPHPREAPS